MQAFKIFLISDEANGLIEIHFDEDIARAALSNFIDEGQSINNEAAGETDSPAKDASLFFHMEEISVDSADDLKKIYEQYGSKSGAYDLNVLLEAEEKGFISTLERIEAQE